MCLSVWYNIKFRKWIFIFLLNIVCVFALKIFYLKYKVKNDGSENQQSEDKPDRIATCEIPPLDHVEQFLDYGRRNGKLSCLNLVEIGGSGRDRFNPMYWPYNEAARIVCLDQIIPNNCTVLSFGVGKDYSFEHIMDKSFGCKVFMFDHTIGQSSYRVSPNNVFYDFGVSDRKKTVSIKRMASIFGSELVPLIATAEVDRYEAIVENLNLSSHQIDYLKVDIDTSDLAFLFDILKTPGVLRNVKQLGMELHPKLQRSHGQPWRDVVLPYWEVMHRLECLGFDLISFIPNTHPVCITVYNKKIINLCLDAVYYYSVSK